MLLNSLTAISPIDGRYRSKTDKLAAYFSEFALIRYRLKVEVEYFIKLSELNLPGFTNFPESKIDALRAIYTDFSLDNALQIKEIEKITNHDVKAVEYFLRNCFDAEGLGAFKEYIHFGLTSQDINNTAIPHSIAEGLSNAMMPAYYEIFNSLAEFSNQYGELPMLAHTHGQPASPTTLGKEFAVFVERLEKALNQLSQIEFFGKFGGATGNFNAHYVAFPEVNWMEFADDFLGDSFQLLRNYYTTQIDHYDDLANIFDNMRRINVILIDLCRDVWSYISMDYFTQKVIANEVGSSAMPHKVNPIDFENAEGNLGLANAMFDHLSNKLPVSRLQRDLTDSTVLRNIGVPISHTLIALESITKGLKKLIVNNHKIESDLLNNWAVVAEAIQTILRREAYPHPYDKLKEFSRGKGKLQQSDFIEFIDSLGVSDKIKAELKNITPFNYTGAPWSPLSTNEYDEE